VRRFGDQPHAVPPLPDSGPSSSGPRSTSGSCRVLMVDDEELIRRMAAGMARRIQVDLVTVGTAGEALEVARSTDIHVLITDMVLGEGLDGIALAHQIGAARPDLSLVLMSGYEPSQFDLEGLPAGTQFLMKPFNSDSLSRCITAARQHAASRTW